MEQYIHSVFPASIQVAGLVSEPEIWWGINSRVGNKCTQVSRKGRGMGKSADSGPQNTSWKTTHDTR